MNASTQFPSAGRKKVASNGSLSSEPVSQYPALPVDTLNRRAEVLTQTAAETDVLPLVHFALKASCTFLFEFREGEKKPPQSVNWHGDAQIAELLKRDLDALAAQSITGSKSTSKFVRTANTKYLIVGVPCKVGNNTWFLGAVIANSKASLGSACAAILQGYTTWFFYTRSDAEKRKENGLFTRVSALLELIGLCAAAGDVKEGAALLVDHLKEIIGCQTVALVSKKRGRYRLEAVSGGIELDQTSEGGAALEACIADAAGRNEILLKDPSSNGEFYISAGASGEMARIFGATGWLVSPLHSSPKDGKVIGGWVFLWNAPDPEFEEKRRFLNAAAIRIGPFLQLILSAKPDGVRALSLRIWKRLKTLQRRALIIFIMMIVVAGLIPIPEKVRSSCRVEPLSRRVVAAPFDGILRDSRVEVGDRVEIDQLLAELDGREVRSRLVETVANRVRADKEADRAMEAGKIAESQMAALEAESFYQQQIMLEERQKNLQVRSPVSGIVLKGDLERAEGVPVRMGDQLFEIAPIRNLLVEIDLPANHMNRVEEGMPVRFRVDAHPHETFAATLLKISPQSEIRNGRNVFVCEAEIGNAEEMLRPGMRGNAKISGRPTPTLWTFLRPAVNWVRLKLWI